MGLDKDRLWFILNAGNLPQQSLGKCSNDGILMGPYKDRLCFLVFIPHYLSYFPNL